MNACGTQENETERLILRPFVYEDAGSMMRNWAGDDYVQKMYGEPSYKTIDAVKKLLDKYIGSYGKKYYFRWAVIEKKIVGREFTVGILRGEVLPPVEIIPESGFYDYQNKYQGTTKEICPAPSLCITLRVRPF